MADRISADQLIDDLTTVIRDAENLLRATAAQTGDKVAEVRARAEESVRQAKVRLEGIEEEALEACARAGRRSRRIRPRQSVASRRNRRRCRSRARPAHDPPLTRGELLMDYGVDSSAEEPAEPARAARSAGSSSRSRTCSPLRLASRRRASSSCRRSSRKRCTASPKSCCGRPSRCSRPAWASSCSRS